ncbi:MAG TPA: FAD-dependent oxidoreductase [Solirubrobacteraceae bacterium]|nr:FAD-dependent oxidoreductase [Solirubrobacteraceae bacterium]
MSERGSQLIVIGAGAAGLYTALRASRSGARVTLVSATPLAGASSYWAQGGLAAAIAPEDSPELHLADTVNAGRGAVRESAARILCEEAPAAVEDLARMGVRFDTDEHGRPSLALEGGHSVRRVVHAGGAATGRRIIQQLSTLATADPLIEILDDRPVTALLSHEGRCVGVRIRGGQTLTAPATVLATGGAAALWARTTNPPGATGSGLLLAHHAGAELADMEFMQFHPTALVGNNGSDGLLVTEAVRGEGAVLVDDRGERFVNELAPRDEVALAVQETMLRTGARSVGLDMRTVDPALFPNVVAALRSSGIDPERELIPVAPAAHYMMGGVASDLDARSSLPGLYAVGECSCTGLHGANRLASNSLTECFVFGARAARAALSEPAAPPASAVAPPPSGRPPELTEESRQALWRSAGLSRDEAGLTELTGDPHPLVRLVAAGALQRTESRGAHRRSDFTHTDPAFAGEHVTLQADRAPKRMRWE